MASRYRPQESLIGPLVYPYYLLALRGFLALTALASLVGVVPSLQDGSATLGGWLEALVTDLLMIAGWTTVLAAAADYTLKRRHNLERWRPSSAAPLIRPDGAPSSDATGPDAAIQAAETITGVVDRALPAGGRLGGTVVAALTGIWWLLGVRTPALVFGEAAALVTWGPWSTGYTRCFCQRRCSSPGRRASG